MKPTAYRITRSGIGAALLWLLLCPAGLAADPQILPLWPGDAPGSGGRSGEKETVRVTERGDHVVSNVHAPSLTWYAPRREQATGAAIVVIPGGGHAELWMDHEGYRVAEYLAGHGIAAFILKYRLAHQPGSSYSVEGDELADARRAIRLVRSRAAEWQIDPQRIGVLGFSAGGELAFLASTRYEDAQPAAADPIARVSSRPDFQALLYPGIPAELRVTAATPPAFLLCGADDQTAISSGLAELYLAMRRAGAKAELHIYAGVGHGFGLRAENAGPSAAWPQRVLDWMDQQGLMKRP
ncbi:MAG TPA: alpha/beta hydrolase [Steroidobacteraceae bacterium]|nr:alpha/beta hydrolase [Steroidobacteraceae bacterium]